MAILPRRKVLIGPVRVLKRRVRILREVDQLVAEARPPGGGAAGTFPHSTDPKIVISAPTR